MTGALDGPGDGGVRLQKFLAHAGVCSRREGERYIQDGRVSVDGRVVRTLGTRVDPARQVVRVDGRVVAMEDPVVLLMNKPDGVVCSAAGATDERGRPTVLSLLRGVRERVYPVGRLDYHTRGALLLTNDGDLAAALTHPRGGVPKVYHVKFQGRLSLDELQRLREGVVLDDGVQTRPIEELYVLEETHTNTWVHMVLHQGLNRQIRRMGEAIGHTVLKLIRVGVADLTTEGLAEGKVRRLDPAEVAHLREVAGLAARPRKGRKKRTSPRRAGPGARDKKRR